VLAGTAGKVAVEGASSGLRRGGRLRREQQADDRAPGPRPRGARHPGLRADRGLL